MTKHLLLYTALVFVPVTRAAAQDAGPQAARVTAMRKLDVWVGNWSGSGWSVSGDGKRTEFTITESVQRKAGGAVLLLDGIGKTGSAGSEKIVHDGITVVSYDANAKRYRWSGHDAVSGAVDAEPVLIDGGLQWSLKPDAQGTVIRFTILLDARRWLETGEVSIGGGPWNKFMEVLLERRR